MAQETGTPPQTDAHGKLRIDRSCLWPDAIDACPSSVYGGIDGLILLGVSRDLLVSRRVHSVYRIALPLLVIAQVIAAHIFLHRTAFWIRIAHALMS